MNRDTGTGSVRIIAGRWKRRRLIVPNVSGLRPTPNRARETLFNWLGNEIVDARCLDLFAGSGALGLEAASRGAAKVVLVEQNTIVFSALLGAINDLLASENKVTKGHSRIPSYETPYTTQKRSKGPFTVSGTMPEITIVHSDALQYLKRQPQHFDVIFLDPPFNTRLLEDTCRILNDGQWLHGATRVYLEMKRSSSLPILPEGWKVTHNSTAGDVSYVLT